METFTTMNEVLAGATMGCVIGEHYRNVMGGDAYYYLHETNPYPFTKQQLKAIDAFGFEHVLCKNSNLEFVTKLWYVLESPQNPKVFCKDLLEFDVAAWEAS